jgi:hypothetical protein
LFLRFLPKPDGDADDFYLSSLATVAPAEQPLQTPHWTTIAVEADLPDAAGSFVIGLVMTGNGVALFGDLGACPCNGFLLDVESRVRFIVAHEQDLSSLGR